MKKISTSICLGLGDNIIARMIFDTVKHQYDQIRISHDKGVMNHYKKGDIAYATFLNEIGTLLFTEPPYFFDAGSYPAIHTLNTIKNFSPIAKPDLQSLLCKGAPFDIGGEYICITTKIRMISKRKFLPLSIGLWKALRGLSNKYKIVIMGERELEESAAYKNDLPSDVVYTIYNHIVANVPADRIIDLTVPSLGLIAPKLSKIQQDGLILKGARAVITLGDGGNLWHAIATSNKVVGYRDDNDHAADAILHPNFTHVKMCKDWNVFIRELEIL